MCLEHIHDVGTSVFALYADNRRPAGAALEQAKNMLDADFGHFNVEFAVRFSRFSLSKRRIRPLVIRTPYSISTSNSTCGFLTIYNFERLDVVFAIRPFEIRTPYSISTSISPCGLTLYSINTFNWPCGFFTPYSISTACSPCESARLIALTFFITCNYYYVSF
ncbi:hypothetical protein HELRODRAFT_163022 [Helobdella robusta]|uniref:Uncharacterized protein n=1 Tax=Helobdella robusta TaxID=6412 RepID=T1ETL0_HELRO|nr:hypothetical protein HELRODRAFT_163022 [Helobdella robusta]ESN99472.1 hypothetical protein HELRODRAFT_163022 [Helobdella robusta]